MTDGTNNIAGMYKHRGPKPTVILNEGAPTVVASGMYYGGEGQTEKVLSWAAPIAEGNLVAVAVETWNTWAATDGIIVVEKPTSAEAFVIGRVASLPKLVNMPANTAAGATPADQLAGGYFRTAKLELMAGITALLKAEVRSDGSTAITAGSTTLLKTNLVSDYADDDTTEIKLQAAASAGTGLIAMHHCVAGSAGDTLNCLVGVTGLMTAITGA